MLRYPRRRSVRIVGNEGKPHPRTACGAEHIGRASNSVRSYVHHAVEVEERDVIAFRQRDVRAPQTSGRLFGSGPLPEMSRLLSLVGRALTASGLAVGTGRAMVAPYDSVPWPCGERD